MSLKTSSLSKIGVFTKKATNPLQYDSVNLAWEKAGMGDSPTRQFFREYLERSMEDLTGKGVIDIGSGTGYLTELFGKFGATDIYGIEPSHKNVKISRKLNPKMVVEEKTLAKAKTKKFFDVAVVMMVFEHLPNLDSAFRQIARLVKPAGNLYAVVSDNKYLTTERFGYTLKIENWGNSEGVVATKRSYGVMYDIFRPVSSFSTAAKKNGFSLTKKIALKPTKKLLQAEPKYKRFIATPLAHLLIFKRLG